MTTLKLNRQQNYENWMKLPIIVYSLFFVVRESHALWHYLQYAPGGMDFNNLMVLSSRLAVIGFLLVLVGLNAIRVPPVNKAPGIFPRVSAILGTVVSVGVLFLPRAPANAWLDLLSTVFLLVGNYLCIYTVLHLGRSISIMAEARRLVTSGPYRWIRHPLYFCEEIAILGVFLQFRTLEAALILVLHFMFQIQRMRNEESVLSATFPEYESYKSRTHRFIPGVW